MIALFVGRFQPFHLGHLEVIKGILKENDKVIIAVGSSQESGTKENPFSFEDRERMIRDCLNSEGIRNFEIIGIPDFMDDQKWVSDIQKKASFDRVYSTNPWTIRCFRKAGIPIKEYAMHEREKYSATGIRNRIVEKKEWESLVPDKVAECINGNGLNVRSTFSDKFTRRRTAKIVRGKCGKI